MKAALRPALPLLIGIALAGVLALVAMHSLAFGTPAATLGSHHSVGYAAVSGHSHGAVDVEVAEVDAVDAKAAAEVDAVDAELASLDGGSEHGVHDHAVLDSAVHEHATYVPASDVPAAFDHAAHGHDTSAVCASPGGAECCSAAANVSGAPTFVVHAVPGATVSALAASVPAASLLATEAAQRPPSLILLSVFRV